MAQIAEIHVPWYPWLLGWWPPFRPLHNDPRVIARAKELGIPLQGGP